MMPESSLPAVTTTMFPVYGFMASIALVDCVASAMTSSAEAPLDTRGAHLTPATPGADAGAQRTRAVDGAVL